MTTCLWCFEKITPIYSFFDILIYDKARSPLCDKCRSQLEALKETTSCIGCGRKQESATLCSDCLQWRRMYPEDTFQHTALFAYNSFAKEYMKQFKMMGDCELAGMFSCDLKSALKKPGREVIIVPIPISERSQKERGFNQTELLLKKANISYMPLLKNNSLQKKQSLKDKGERMQSTQPFEVDKQFEHNIIAKEVILVDDIYTTGRTLFHARDSLKPYAAAKVKTVSLFR